MSTYQSNLSFLRWQWELALEVSYIFFPPVLYYCILKQTYYYSNLDLRGLMNWKFHCL